MHGLNLMEFSQGIVGNFPVDKVYRHYTDYFAPQFQYGVGYDSHYTHITTSVNKANPFAGQQLTQGSGFLGIDWIVSRR